MSVQRFVLIGNTARVSVARRGLPEVSTIGGAGFNTAIGAIAAGVRPTLITVVGSDLSLDEHASVEAVAGPPYLQVAPGNTCHFQFTYDADDCPPVIVSDYGNAGLLNGHATTFFLACHWVHISCRNPLESRRLLRHVREWRPERLSIDFIYSSLTQQIVDVASDLGYVDYIFVNSVEFDVARAWLGPDAFPGNTVVTRGAQGAVVFGHGGILAEAPAQTVDVVDATGAGDAFAGAFLARVIEGDSLAEALSAAVVVGTKKVQGIGMTTLLRSEVISDGQ